MKAALIVDGLHQEKAQRKTAREVTVYADTSIVSIRSKPFLVLV